MQTARLQIAAILMALLCQAAFASEQMFVFDERPPQVKTAVERLKSHPDDEQTFHQACFFYIWNQDWKSLKRLTEIYAKKHSDWAALHLALARYAEKNMDEDEAISQCKQAIKIRPDWVGSRVACVTMLRNSGKTRECVDLANESLKYCQGKDKMSQVMRLYLLQETAPALVTLNRNAEAAKVLQEVVDSGFPDVWKSRDELANLYVTTREWKKAIRVTSDTLKIDKKSRNAYFARAQAYFGDGQYKRALDDVNACLALMPSGPKEFYTVQTRQARQLKIKILEALGQKALAAKERATIEKEEGNAYGDAPFRNKP